MWVSSRRWMRWSPVLPIWTFSCAVWPKRPFWKPSCVSFCCIATTTTPSWTHFSHASVAIQGYAFIICLYWVCLNGKARTATNEPDEVGVEWAGSRSGIWLHQAQINYWEPTSVTGIYLLFCHICLKWHSTYNTHFLLILSCFFFHSIKVDLIPFIILLMNELN